MSLAVCSAGSGTNAAPTGWRTPQAAPAAATASNRYASAAGKRESGRSAAGSLTGPRSESIQAVSGRGGGDGEGRSCDPSLRQVTAIDAPSARRRTDEPRRHPRPTRSRMTRQGRQVSCLRVAAPDRPSRIVSSGTRRPEARRLQLRGQPRLGPEGRTAFPFHPETETVAWATMEARRWPSMHSRPPDIRSYTGGPHPERVRDHRDRAQRHGCGRDDGAQQEAQGRV